MSQLQSSSSQSINVQQFSPRISAFKSQLHLGTKSQLQIKRQRKKQFITFLNPVESSPPLGLPKRKLSSSAKQQQQVIKICKICNFIRSESSRQCDFCKQTVCFEHLRKRRRNRETNKFNRICDHCEDKYLVDKHLKNQLKIEESLTAQQTIVSAQHHEMKEMLDNKRVRWQVQLNKNKQLFQKNVQEVNTLQSLNDQLGRKTKKLEQNNKECAESQISLQALEKTLPPSLQADYNYLIEQNERITRQLVKYEKLCNDAIQARCQRQKKMYDEYYKWEFFQRQKQYYKSAEKKECQIY